jgi:hypothetical protein
LHEKQQGAGHGSPPHYLSDGPLPFGEIRLGQEHYNEFVCSKSTASWLKAGGMTHIDGKRVTLQMKDECTGGHNVVMGFWTKDERC